VTTSAPRQAWGLLPSLAMACARACTAAETRSPPVVNFPVWLGKNSSRMKRARLLAELGLHMGGNTSGGREAIRLDMLDPLRTRLLLPLCSAEAAAEPLQPVHTAIAILDEYGLSNVRGALGCSAAAAAQSSSAVQAPRTAPSSLTPFPPSLAPLLPFLPLPPSL
jgi:hypothetical protein